MKELFHVVGLITGLLSIVALGALVAAGAYFTFVKRHEDGEL